MAFLLASDLANTDFVNSVPNPDDLLSVRFEVRRVKNTFKSDVTGVPVFEDRDFVVIELPGDKLNMIDTLATEEHKVRFTRQWQEFSLGREDIIKGTPLEDWQALQPGQLEELKYYKFKTVEQFANASFGLVQKMGGFYVALQERARKELKIYADNLLASELQERDEQLKAQSDLIKGLQDQLSELIKTVNSKK